MILLDAFYTITEIEPIAPQHYRVPVILAAEHSVYEGHFPGNPVVPGVCTLQMVVECAEKILGCPVFMYRAPVVKFLEMIRPGVHTHLVIDMTIDADMNVKASVTTGERKVMSCKIKLKNF